MAYTAPILGQVRTMGQADHFLMNFMDSVLSKEG